MKPMSKLLRNPGIYAAAVMLCALSGGASAQTAPYAPPLSPRAKLNFDLNWKFVRDDVPGAEAPSFDLVLLAFTILRRREVSVVDSRGLLAPLPWCSSPSR